MQHLGSSSLTRDQTVAPCIGSVECQPLHHQGSLIFCILPLNVNLLDRHHLPTFQVVGPFCIFAIPFRSSFCLVVYPAVKARVFLVDALESIRMQPVP